MKGYECDVRHRCTKCGRRWTHTNGEYDDGCYIVSNLRGTLESGERLDCQECGLKVSAMGERFVDDFVEWAEKVREEAKAKL